MQWPAIDCTPRRVADPAEDPSHRLLAQRLARAIHARHPQLAELDDLVSAAWLALVEASRRYDPSVRTPFWHFARKRVTGATWDELARACAIPRATYRRGQLMRRGEADLTRRLGRAPSLGELASALGVSPSALDAQAAALDALRATNRDPDSLSALGAIDAEQRLLRRDLVRRVLERAQRLPPRTRAAVIWRVVEGLSYVEIGERLSISASRAAQLCKQGVTRLRDWSRDLGSPEPPGHVPTSSPPSEALTPDHR